MNDRTIHADIEDHGEEPENNSGLSYHTLGQMYRGDSLLVKVKIHEEGGTIEEVAADYSEKEGVTFRVADNEGNPEEGEFYIVKD